MNGTCRQRVNAASVADHYSHEVSDPVTATGTGETAELGDRLADQQGVKTSAAIWQAPCANLRVTHQELGYEWMHAR